jgi:hypothetical protein
MAQLNVYVPDEAAVELKESAKSEGLSLSSYVVKVLTRSKASDGWPEGYFDQLGGWEGDFPRPEQGEFDV